MKNVKEHDTNELEKKISAKYATLAPHCKCLSVKDIHEPLQDLYRRDDRA